MKYSFEVENTKYEIDLDNPEQVDGATTVLISAINREQTRVYELQRRPEPRRSNISEIEEAEKKIEAYKSLMNDIIELRGSQPGEN